MENQVCTKEKECLLGRRFLFRTNDARESGYLESHQLVVFVYKLMNEMTITTSCSVGKLVSAV